jgi:hypothetical protein
MMKGVKDSDHHERARITTMSIRVVYFVPMTP